MIGWLQGQLTDRWQQNSRCGLLLVCQGVGYEVLVPLSTFDRLHAVEGLEVDLRTH